MGLVIYQIQCPILSPSDLRAFVGLFSKWSLNQVQISKGLNVSIFCKTIPVLSTAFGNRASSDNRLQVTVLVLNAAFSNKASSEFRFQ